MSRAGCPPLRDRIILEKHFTVYRLKKSALVFPEKNIWLTLKIKAFMRSMSRSFHYSLSPCFRETKKFHPPLQPHNAKLPSN